MAASKIGCLEIGPGCLPTSILAGDSAHDSLQSRIVPGKDGVVLHRPEMRDEFFAVPKMKREAWRCRHDHGPPVRLVGIDRVEVERELRGSRRAHNQHFPRPKRDDRTVKMAGDEAHYIVMLRNDAAQPLGPERVGVFRHPA